MIDKKKLHINTKYNTALYIDHVKDAREMMEFRMILTIFIIYAIRPTPVITHVATAVLTQIIFPNKLIHKL
jgi:hypothetical protein